MAQRKSRRPGPRKSPSGLSLRRAADGGWVLVHPRCVRDRAEDVEEVRAMIAAGELDVAVDELRWLLSGCSEFIEAHCLLGELALEKDHDAPLARGHFGFGYQLGLQALRRAEMPSPLPGAQPANRSFFESGRGLVWCLDKLGHAKMADEVVATLTKLDPADPLGIGQLLETIRSDGLPIVDLLDSFLNDDRGK